MAYQGQYIDLLAARARLHHADDPAGDLMFLLAQRYIVAGLTAGAVKG